MKERILKSAWTPVVIMSLSVLMMAYGGFRGEMKVVLDKAIRICMECIGIG